MNFLFVLRLLDCVPIVNGALADIVTSVETARKRTDMPADLTGLGKQNSCDHGSRLYGQVIGCKPEDRAIGMRVEAISEVAAIPRFKPIS